MKSIRRVGFDGFSTRAVAGHHDVDVLVVVSHGAQQLGELDGAFLVGEAADVEHDRGVLRDVVVGGDRRERLLAGREHAVGNVGCLPDAEGSDLLVQVWRDDGVVGAVDVEGGEFAMGATLDGLHEPVVRQELARVDAFPGQFVLPGEGGVDRGDDLVPERGGGSGEAREDGLVGPDQVVALVVGGDILERAVPPEGYPGCADREGANAGGVAPGEAVVNVVAHCLPLRADALGHLRDAEAVWGEDEAVHVGISDSRLRLRMMSILAVPRDFR